MRNVQMYNPTHWFDTQSESGPTSEPTVDWEHSFQSRVREVAVWDGTVYCTTKGGSINALRTDGTPLWRFQTDGEVNSSPAVVDDIVYVGSHDNHVYALDAAHGTEQWAFETDDRVWSSPAVVDGTVYVGSNDTHVYALDAASGTRRRTFETGGPVRSSPAMVDGTVYVVSLDTHVYALDAAFGSEQWRSSHRYGARPSSPAVADGTVYSVDVEHLRTLDAASGTQQWRFDPNQIGDGQQSSPVVADGTVYMGGGETVYALSGTDTEVFTPEDDQRDTTSIYAMCSNCSADLSDLDSPTFCTECGQQDPL